jgi:hypothetical protein
MGSGLGAILAVILLIFVTLVGVMKKSPTTFRWRTSNWEDRPLIQVVT